MARYTSSKDDIRPRSGVFGKWVNAATGLRSLVLIDHGWSHFPVGYWGCGGGVPETLNKKFFSYLGIYSRYCQT